MTRLTKQKLDSLTFEFLYQEYIENKKSQRTIAKIVGCSDGTVAKFLKLLSIPIRNLSDSHKGIRYKWFKGKVKNRGYVYLWMPKHKQASQRGYVSGHRFVIEKYIGRLLKPREKTHHVNSKKTDNRIENLMLFVSQSAHKRFEMGAKYKQKEIIFDGRKIKKETLC